jgi:acetamidase/formamidase
MPARHRLIADVGTVHRGAFDPAYTAVLTVDPGDLVELTTLSGGLRDLPDTDAGFTVTPEHRAVLETVPPGIGPHLMTGPIHVRGARPGDELVVELVEIELAQDWGWNVIVPGEGTLPGDFPHERRIHVAIDRERRTVTLPWGLELKAQPFFGVIGVAPTPGLGRQTSLIPGDFGGNLDNRLLQAGTQLHLPVFNDGALVSVGDGHALQGDGEVNVSAIETALAGTLRLTVIPGTGLTQPWAQTPTHYVTMAFHRDLDQAAEAAVRSMVGLAQRVGGLTAPDAYTLCSIAADVAVTQLVNINKGVHVTLPKATLT